MADRRRRQARPTATKRRRAGPTHCRRSRRSPPTSPRRATSGCGWKSSIVLRRAAGRRSSPSIIQQDLAGLHPHREDARRSKAPAASASQGGPRGARRHPQRRPRQAGADQDIAVRMKTPRRLALLPAVAAGAAAGAGAAARSRRHRPGRRHHGRLHHPDVRPAHHAFGGAGPADHGDELHPLRHRLLDPARRHRPADARPPT